MTTQDMVGLADILDCFRYFSGVGLKSIPHSEDADTWLRVLSDVPAVLLHLAADEWIRRPVKDKGGVLRGQRWSPTAGELRSVAFGLEATQRVETTQRKRGCASCGEVIDENGGIVETGTGHRTISQHCYPAAPTGGGTDWSATPYRIASRQVLCDCELGKWINHVHTTADRDKRLYECPIYRKPRRTDLEFVVMVDLRMPVNPDKWTLRGVALLCDTR